MKFIKWFIDKHGILIGGGTLMILFLTLVALSVFTRGFILIFVPIGLLVFVVSELFEYSVKRNR
jgi:hypothetical protein